MFDERCPLTWTERGRMNEDSVERGERKSFVVESHKSSFLFLWHLTIERVLPQETKKKYFLSSSFWARTTIYLVNVNGKQIRSIFKKPFMFQSAHWILAKLTWLLTSLSISKEFRWSLKMIRKSLLVTKPTHGCNQTNRAKPQAVDTKSWWTFFLWLSREKKMLLPLNKPQ